MSIRSQVSGLSVLLSGVLLMAAGPLSAQRASNVEAALAEAAEHVTNLRPAEAESAYRRALDMSPDNPDVLVQYGSFKRRWGHNSEALDMLMRARELAPDDGFILYQLGVAYRFARRYGAANATLRLFIGNYPTQGPARTHLAYTDIARGNRGAALRNLQAAEQLLGDDINSWRTVQIAFGYAQLGRREDVERLVASLEGMDEVSQAGWALGYIALGDYGQALERLESAVNNPESFGGALNILHQIRSNPFGDPALAGQEFRAVLSGLGSP